MFDALSAARPYREALPLEKVFSILKQEASGKLDPDCVAVIEQRHSHARTAVFQGETMHRLAT